MIFVQLLALECTVFSRPLNNPFDDVLPNGPKGCGMILMDNKGAPDILTFEEYGVMRYTISVPRFKDDNENRTSPNYRFKALNGQDMPYKDENYTWRSEERPCRFPEYELQNFFKTITFGVTWDNFMSSADLIRENIMRETEPKVPVYNKQAYGELREIWMDWLDAMLGVEKEDTTFGDL